MRTKALDTKADYVITTPEVWYNKKNDFTVKFVYRCQGVRYPKVTEMNKEVKKSRAASGLLDTHIWEAKMGNHP